MIYCYYIINSITFCYFGNPRAFNDVSCACYIFPQSAHKPMAADFSCTVGNLRICFARVSSLFLNKSQNFRVIFAHGKHNLLRLTM